MARLIAVLLIVIGFGVQLLLDGQTFTHAIIGSVCGALAAGIAYVTRYQRSRLEVSANAVLVGGLLLFACCMINLPGSYALQQKFNAAQRSHRTQAS